MSSTRALRDKLKVDLKAQGLETDASLVDAAGADVDREMRGEKPVYHSPSPTANASVQIYTSWHRVRGAVEKLENEAAESEAKSTSVVAPTPLGW